MALSSRRSWFAIFLLSCNSATPAPSENNPGMGGGGMGASENNPGMGCGEGRVGVTALMKLSTVQYRNTVRDLVAAVGASQSLPSLEGALGAIPDDSLAEGFRGRDNRTSVELVQGYFNVGRALGDAILKNPSLLVEVAGACAAEPKLSPACVDAFLDRFVKLAYRRPLLEAERADYEALNDGQRTPGEAIRAMVIVALTSPRFVYHVEVDGDVLAAPDVFKLTPYEIASRLSFTFWQTMPDAELLAAAEDGTLASEAGFDEQLGRVFADPRTQQTLWSFWNEWLRFEKFTGFEATRPALTALAQGESLGQPGHDHYRDMVEEVRKLTQLFTFTRTATLAELLTTDVSVTQSADLARLYGVQPWSGSGDYPRMPAGTRAGLLQRAALLVSNLEQTNPFHRGAFVRRNLLCDPLPQPDPNSLPPGSLDPPVPSSAQTTRQRFQAKVEGKALCQGCHGTFSDLGYVLESFDALGRFRSVEQVFDEKTGEKLADLPLDTRAVPKVSAGDSTEVGGAAELNQRLVASGKVEACLARQYFEFAMRRAADEDTFDACAVHDLAAILKDPERGLAGAFRQLARYRSFSERRVGAP
jgi:hypothetical protein